jgi:flagellar hook protein FlgE
MINAVSDPVSTALSGLLRIQNRIAADAGNIASGGARTGAANLPGGQPANAAAQVSEAQGGDIESSLVDVLAAKAGYQANVAVIKAASDMNRKMLDILS